MQVRQNKTKVLKIRLSPNERQQINSNLDYYRQNGYSLSISRLVREMLLRLPTDTFEDRN